METRFVLSGIGPLTFIGTGFVPCWEALLAGRSSFGPVQSSDPTPYKVNRGAEIKAFRVTDYLAHVNPASMGRASQLATAAARLAIADAQLDLQTIEPERAGVSMGTTSGEPREIERFDDHFVNEALEQRQIGR